MKNSSGYQPKTGVKCDCRPGFQRDNCFHCEGTGWQIDFNAIRAGLKERLSKSSAVENAASARMICS